MRLSIVIPTRTRFEYLRHSLACALSVPETDVEIVVSDNLSQDETPAYLASLTDPRLRVVRPDRPLSMRQNFEFALKAARGDYVLFHGDDDAVLPQQIGALLTLLDREKPDALSWHFPVYGWPNPELAERLGNFRLLKSATFGGITPLDVPRLRRALETATLESLNFGPGLYHAVMKRAYIHEVLARDDGECILSMSPDTYMTMRAILAGGRFIRVGHPFSINGYGHRSNGGSTKVAGNVKNEFSSFQTQAQQDPVRDVLPINKCVAFGYFNVLETLRHAFPEPALKLDLERWYRRILFETSRRKDADERAAIIADVEFHAEKLGDPAALARAKADLRPFRHKLAIRWAYNKNKWGSFRLDGAHAGTNTVATAVARCDHVLGRDYEAVVAGRVSKAQAWRDAMKRKDGLDQTDLNIPGREKHDA